MAVIISLISVLIAIFLGNLTFINPRARHILFELREETIKAIPPLTDEFNFTLYIAWHSTCHSLERRKSRIHMWLGVIWWSTTIGTFLAAIVIAVYLFGLVLPDVAVRVMRGFVGLSLLIAIVALVEPSLLIRYHRP